MHIWINQAEATWLEPLQRHSEDLFSTTFLPSHDHTHHLRVWNICKALLNEISGIQAKVDQELVEGLLIAAWFHDLGMVQSTREDHGNLGRKMCESYFKKKNTMLPSRFDEARMAIEQHDLKSLKRARAIGPGSSPEILEILTIADDLEALGTIGIYRYSEIYLKRDKNLRTLGLRILHNVFIRYKNLQESCRYFPGLMTVYQQQYEQLVSFFIGYNQHLLVASEPGDVSWGHLGVINHIRTHSVDGMSNPLEFLPKSAMGYRSDFVTNYLNALQDELEQARE